MGMIYVLTQGEYSDYCIVCCTTDHDYAKAYAKLHDCDIEEFEDENDKSIIQEANEMLPYFSIPRMDKLCYMLPRMTSIDFS